MFWSGPTARYSSLRDLSALADVGVAELDPRVLRGHRNGAAVAVPSAEVRGLGALPELRHLVVRGARDVEGLLRLRPFGPVAVELLDVPAEREQRVRDLAPDAQVTVRR